MFIAMNRFKIVPGKEEDFITVWKNRETYLDEVPGFISFNLLQGDSNAEYTLFASHSTWQSREDFTHWTKSEAFRKAHGSAGGNKGLYLGHPEFEGFDTVI
ncbi:antibiotic biosynthesis monooxygenase family protein [Oleiphilus messinensis]|uniref:Antibiotic biosynthesis monooxygenase family protein n=1 Tax=Oleiphilus messinensis TaxID=141451 RepID=A0A1Y0IAT2_9GAMM|nr:antibiotic biosynthesis monooxygenase [Oleiphilus messinensis]ARU56866.1 antibiotic biosynthesis monooxygenase family protein [Oleiphilus messinensis]